MDSSSGSILERIKTLLDKADKMDEEFREAVFRKAVAEYLDSHRKNYCDLTHRYKKTR